MTKHLNQNYYPIEKIELFDQILSEQLTLAKKRLESLEYFIDKPYLLEDKAKKRITGMCKSELKLVGKYEKQAAYWLLKTLTREETLQVVLFSAKLIEWEIVLNKILVITYGSKKDNII